jgi:hypothetical protein
VHALKASKESLLTELAATRGKQLQSAAQSLSSPLDAFSRTLRRRSRDQWPKFGKCYLNVLVEEIAVNGDEETPRGSCDRLAVPVQSCQETWLDQVPSFLGELRTGSYVRLVPAAAFLV